MKNAFLFFSALFFSAVAARAQDSTATNPLVITGSVDTYYKYDFSGRKFSNGSSNIGTSFANEQNSVSIGMIDLGLKKKVGKVAFVGELSFGPRGQSQSIPDAATAPVSGTTFFSSSSFHIQNLYVSYDLTPKLNVTAGYMSTFVGYEVILPTGNFNYSTSYLFTNGPFQNAGLKATYAFSDKVSLMAGIFNDYWNVYQSVNDVSTFGAQLMVSPVKGWTAYLNLLTGYASGTEVDLTTTYQITEAFKLGLNAADFSSTKYLPTGGFSGVALYPQLAVSKMVTLGLRGEYFKSKSGSVGPAVGAAPGSSVTDLTATANIKTGPFTFIPEVRLDNGSKAMFLNHSLSPTQSASQFVMAAVYSF
ncbi:porin [Mucilaginibacter arboris]|uniref:Outer membrane beta-barrel protein n=1 Tax=Mucilaginibacter arboris TaxID=2682090 RepID=A0A7K1T0S6_9SPHI|nr:porin [Mucilaginibacter arboris]MVN23138.1 outer membrane beta-barrel protein [Mucilaginibacter arboris]